MRQRLKPALLFFPPRLNCRFAVLRMRLCGQADKKVHADENDSQKKIEYK